MKTLRLRYLFLLLAVNTKFLLGLLFQDRTEQSVLYPALRFVSVASLKPKLAVM